MEGILKALCLNQVHPNNAPTTASPVIVLRRRIGTYGLTSGIIMPPPVGNLKCPLDDGHIQLTGNGCGTPPQLTIFIKWRMKLFTTISHPSPDATHAQIWVRRLPGQSCSVRTMFWACQSATCQSATSTLSSADSQGLPDHDELDHEDQALLQDEPSGKACFDCHHSRLFFSLAQDLVVPPRWFFMIFLSQAKCT